MDVYYSLHAQKQIAERDVTHQEIEAVVRTPEVTYRGKPSKEGPSRVYQRGDLAVATAPVADGVLVITVLWRHEEQWTDEQMKEQRR